MDDRIGRMRALTREAHAGQTCNGGRLPYWVHTDAVAQLVGTALARSGELSPADAEDVVLAAYGHDLYEDTGVTAAQIEQEFGPRVARWIGRLTNCRGDHDRAEYQQGLAAADEEVRLVTCADLADNTLSVAYGIHDVGLLWATGFFWPVADETRHLLAATRFERLPVTGAHLLELVDWSWERLKGAVVTADGQEWAGEVAGTFDVSIPCHTDPAKARTYTHLYFSPESLARGRAEEERKVAERRMFGDRAPFPIRDVDIDA